MTIVEKSVEKITYRRKKSFKGWKKFKCFTSLKWKSLNVKLENIAIDYQFLNEVKDIIFTKNNHLILNVLLLVIDK